MTRARILADYVSSGDELALKAPLASPAFTGSPSITLGSDATNDVYYRAASGALTRLGIGADGEVLTSTGASTAPAFEAIPASGGKVVWAGWDDGHNQTPSAFIVPTLNVHLQAIDTDYATIGGTNSHSGGAGTLTIVKAGHYLIQAQVAQHNDASTTHIMKLVVGGNQASYVAMPSSPTGWSSLNFTYANSLAVDETISFACQVGTGDPYVWVAGDYGASAWYAGYSLAELIFLG